MAVHLFAAIALLGFYFWKGDSDFTLKIYSGSTESLLKARYLVWAAALFLAITAGFHFAYANDWFGYRNGAVSGFQYIRWIEYGITATIMAVIVAISSGVNKVNSIVLCAVLTAAIMATGFVFEWLTANKQSKWITLLPLAVGFGLLIWYCIIVYRAYQDRVKESITPVPSWIKWIVIGTLVFFGCFGFVALLRWVTDNATSFYKEAPSWLSGWNPIWFEYMYLVLSLTAKLYLGGFLGYGILARANAPM